MSNYDYEHGRYTCGRVSCPCLHNDPCDRGWISTVGGVRPCEGCKPEVAFIFATAKTNFELNQRLIARGGKRD